MWLTSSSVGRKFVMALTGAALVLFVTFHCLMNSVAILWPTAYNTVCEFLGANWYALIASGGLALLIVIHIIYACWLTLQNRAARGPQRYAVSERPKSVEWASKNMLVLGIFVLAFLGVHLVQFWAKMQLEEVLGLEGQFPAATGTLFINQAFSCWCTPVIYAIGFIALWLHMNHGFWSMFQSCGWDNTLWIPRLKCIGKCWVGIVMVLFFIQLGVFTYNANRGFYTTDPALVEQYAEMGYNQLVPPMDGMAPCHGDCVGCPSGDACGCADCAACPGCKDGKCADCCKEGKCDCPDCKTCCPAETCGCADCAACPGCKDGKCADCCKEGKCACPDCKTCCPAETCGKACGNDCGKACENACQNCPNN